MSRANFIKTLEKLGFESYEPKGTIHKYIPRQFFKCKNTIVAMSEKGTEIEISIYTTTQSASQTIHRFDNYREALKRISTAEAEQQPQATTTTKVRRRKKS